jgi:hypothetical protein
MRSEAERPLETSPAAALRPLLSVRARNTVCTGQRVVPIFRTVSVLSGRRVPAFSLVLCKAAERGPASPHYANVKDAVR